MTLLVLAVSTWTCLLVGVGARPMQLGPFPSEPVCQIVRAYVMARTHLLVTHCREDAFGGPIAGEASVSAETNGGGPR